jgi:ubiquinone/menaquinone biosynthesis C-methylase UbiE
MGRQDVVWQGEAHVRWYLESVRGAIPLCQEQFAVMVQMVANGRVPVRRFLDVGAGAGALSAVLLARFPEAQPVLVDFSPPMLEAARQHLPERATDPAFYTTDLATSAWLDAVSAHAPYDAIVSGFAIHHLEDERKRALYAELHELLAPGGAFAHIEHVAPESTWVARAFDEAMIAALWDFARRTDAGKTREEIAAEYEARPDRAANRLAPLETQLTWLRDAGFTDVVAPFRWYELAVFGGYRRG